MIESRLDASLESLSLHGVWLEDFNLVRVDFGAFGKEASHVNEVAFDQRLSLLLQRALNLLASLVQEDSRVQHLVVEASLAQGRDYALLNLLLVVDEVKVAESFEGALLDQLLTRTLTDAERVQSLLEVALACDELDNFLRVPNRTVCQQEDVRVVAVFRLVLSEDLTQRLEDLSAAKVSLEFLDQLNCVLQICVTVLDAALWEHEFEARPIAANVEPTSSWQTVKEKDERLPRELDCLVHRATSVNKENVLLLLLIL